MSDFRIRYGFALGPYGSAGATSANNLITPGDTTPDVSTGSFFVTANTSATTITYFDVVGAGGIDSTANNGKIITLLFQDNDTTIANAGQLFLSGTGGAMSSGQTLDLIYYNSAWYQKGGTAGGGALRESVKTFTLATTDSAPSVSRASVVLLTPSGGALTIAGFSGGVVGQHILVGKNVVSSGTAVTLLGGADLMLAGTTAFVMNGSAFYGFVCDTPSRFRQISPVIMP